MDQQTSLLAQPPAVNPLTEEHLAQLQQVIDGSALLMDWLMRCEGAGMNVQALKNDCVRRQQLAVGLKAHFFPLHP